MNPTIPSPRVAVSVLTLAAVLGPIGWSAAAEPATTPAGGGQRMVPRFPALFPPEFFPILPWDHSAALPDPEAERQAGLASIAECNFTIAGFVKREDIPACERLGLAAIVRPEEPIRGKQWRELSGEQIDAWVQRLVGDTASSKAVIGYFLVDEPGASEFAALGQAVAAVRRYAPDKLAYINLFPGYATLGAKDTSQLEASSFREYLERYVAEVHPQFLSYDNYMVEFSMDLADAKKAASYFRDLLEVRRVALEHRLPFWNIVSSNQIRPFTTPPSSANLLLQVYTTLAAGGQGVSWYKYYQSGYAYAPVDKANHRTVTWSYLQMVNRQLRTMGPIMNRLHSTGVFFTAPPPAPGLPVLPGKLVRRVQVRTGAAAGVGAGSGAGAPIMVGEFENGAGQPAVMLVNLSLERSARLELQLVHPAGALQRVSPEDGSLEAIDPEHGLWLTAGQGALLRPGTP